MNHDATHCADYDEKVCPKNCYRAELTADLAKRHKEFIGVPISYASLLGTSECRRCDPPRSEAMVMLDQLEDVLKKIDKPEAETRTPTMKAFLVVARVTYFLLSRWVREHESRTKPAR